MAKNKTANTKSPLDDKYLRRPGQSLDEKIGELEGKLLLWIVSSGALIGAILIEWMITLVKIPLEPIFLILPTILVVSFVFYSWLKVNQIKREIQNYKLGRDGERAVAESLDNLIRKTRCYIYHDIVLENNKVKFNIDHIIVSTYGIFVIETKTRRKTDGITNKIEDFDGENIRLTGQSPDPKPVIQALSNARRLAEKIPPNTLQKPFNITAIVVYPGWWVDKNIMRNGRGVWVSNAKYLEFAITQMEPILTTDEVTLLNDKIKEIPGTTSKITE